MDPDATLARLMTALMEGDYDEARDLAEELAEWKRKGGYPPQGS